jgi:hypothetical protein
MDGNKRKTAALVESKRVEVVDWGKPKEGLRVS